VSSTLTSDNIRYMDHVYDFYKPDLHSEFPIVDGPLSTSSYTTAVDKTYNLFLDKVRVTLPLTTRFKIWLKMERSLI
jgi:3-hydroxy-3-methylglutaryl CoA synthase